ncbi:MAG TPA: CARDB domain-containing protein [Thermoleophilaceae bacterium]
MHRLFVGLPIAAAVLTASVACALAAPARGGRTATTQPSVTLADCHPSDLVDQRYASFNGQMRTIQGGKRMAMHFTLLERLGNASGVFKPVPLPDLKPWRRSKSGARTFIYMQRVTALRDNGAYRMRVQFRWYGSGHTVLRSTTVSSRTCRQPAPLPNLTISSISSNPSTVSPGKFTYAITVTNSGQGEAMNVPVVLKVDGVVVGHSQVDLLPAQESSVVQIDGPQCGFTVRAAADPDRLIKETDDSDNALTLPCSQTTA